MLRLKVVSASPCLKGVVQPKNLVVFFCIPLLLAFALLSLGTNKYQPEKRVCFMAPAQDAFCIGLTITFCQYPSIIEAAEEKPTALYLCIPRYTYLSKFLNSGKFFS